MAKFLRPFGPTIYHGRLAEDEISFLQEVAKTTRQARNNVGKRLVGNIKDQMGCFLKSKKESDKFYGILYPHLFEYFKYESDRRSNGEAPIPHAVELDYGNGPWINFQQAGEFNPAHGHTGEVSSVVYIDVPAPILEEKITDHSGKPDAPGQIEFLYGSDVMNSFGGKTMSVKTGDILLFHSKLRHTVYPFRSDVTRISMSFNINKYKLLIKQESK